MSGVTFYSSLFQKILLTACVFRRIKSIFLFFFQIPASTHAELQDINHVSNSGQKMYQIANLRHQGESKRLSKSCLVSHLPNWRTITSLSGDFATANQNQTLCQNEQISVHKILVNWTQAKNCILLHLWKSSCLVKWPN